MKNYINFITENTANEIDWNIIFDDCKPFINELREHLQLYNESYLLYRGVRGSFIPDYYEDQPFDDIYIVNSQKDREPRDTPQIIHNILDNCLYQKFKWYPRSNGVFATSSLSEAEEYGISYIFMPIGDYKYVYSDVKDVYSKIKDELRYHVLEYMKMNLDNVDPELIMDEQHIADAKKYYDSIYPDYWWFNKEDNPNYDKNLPSIKFSLYTNDINRVMGDIKEALKTNNWLARNFTTLPYEYQQKVIKNPEILRPLITSYKEMSKEEFLSNLDPKVIKEKMSKIVKDFKDADLREAIEDEREMIFNCKSYYLIELRYTNELIKKMSERFFN